MDSLTVVLRITAPDRKVVYDRTWSSAGYLECECDDSQRPSQLPGLRADARRYLETFFDSAFIAPAADTGRHWERPDHRMAVLMQLVPQLWDVTQGPGHVGRARFDRRFLVTRGRPGGGPPLRPVTGPAIAGDSR